MRHIRSVTKLIETLGGAAAVARETGIATSTVHSWKVRGSIHPHHWPAVIQLGRQKGVDLDANQLYDMSYRAT